MCIRYILLHTNHLQNFVAQNNNNLPFCTRISYLDSGFSRRCLSRVSLLGAGGPTSKMVHSCVRQAGSSCGLSRMVSKFQEQEFQENQVGTVSLLISQPQKSQSITCSQARPDWRDETPTSALCGDECQSHILRGRDMWYGRSCGHLEKMQAATCAHRFPALGLS